MKFNEYKNKSNLIFSICVASILLAIIIVLDFSLENVKIFHYSIQVFLIFYAIGIYKINNILVNIFFFLVVPPILFALEIGPWIINPLQTFFEYFLVFYIFSFIYLSRFISNIFIKNKHYQLISYLIFIISFSIMICIKYLLHSLASLTWWGKDPWAALVYNVPWLLTNLLTIPIAISTTFPIFKLFYRYENDYKNKW
ncbi:MAG: hypothetical protein HDR43_01630 [Mycoplasma sp.]|nr:hypothetical protein [Mycoplasma sp.]